MNLPSFAVLSLAYLDYRRFPKPEEVRSLIGGEAKDADITNTCTIRLSHAMNASGVAVPRHWERITNRRGKNGNYYILRVGKFRTWMEHAFGKPDLDFKKKAGASFDRSSIEGLEGVIAFEIDFKDAAGHFDLWYKNEFSHERSAGKDYFQLATRISLWTGGTRITRPPA